MSLPMGRRAVLRGLAPTPPEALEHHPVLEPQEAPGPASLSPADVIVAVEAAGVGGVDLLMTSGQYQHVPEPPYTPGMEYAGTVAWRGDAARGVEGGDAVIVDGLLTGPRSLGAYRRWGGLATYAVAPSDAVLPKPAPLSFDEASVLLGAYETAYHCLFHRGDVRAGDVVLVHGASGATGLAAVHLAKLAGATVIATGRSADKLAAVREEGADHVLDTTDLAALRPAVKALTGGCGVDVVYDPVGGPLSVESLRCVAFGARFLVVGWAATPSVAKGKGGRGAADVNVLPTNLILMKSVDVRGCPAAISAHRDPRMRADRRDRIMAWAEAGKITPRVGATFPLASVHDALRAKWESRAVGSVVVHPRG